MIPGRVRVPAPTVWKIQLPWPRPPLALAIPVRGLALASLQRRARQTVRAVAEHGGLPRGLSRVRVVLHWETVLPTDQLDLTETLKTAVDALVGYGLVPRDDSRHVSADWQVQQGRRNTCWLVVTDLHPAG
jgi:hypothetical protein